MLKTTMLNIVAKHTCVFFLFFYFFLDLLLLIKKILITEGYKQKTERGDGFQSNLQQYKDITANFQSNNIISSKYKKEERNIIFNPYLNLSWRVLNG